MSLLAPIWAAEGVGGFDAHTVFGSLYFHPFPTSFGQSPAHPAMRLMRPSVGAAPIPQDVPDWLTGLGASRPLVYLTAGTEAAGLFAPWAAMLEAVAALDIDVVATTGPMLDQATLGTIPANVRLERFLPQQLLLERAAVVASHGGAGTVLGAARLGVPQLLFPIAADQWENADAVARAGAGLVCEEGRRSPAELGEALRQLLTDPGHRQAAQAVADEIAQMPAAADHLAEIEALAR
jgi:UDP:flavonoid glycosyltransferase YjiC (YdhE family)